MFLLSAFLLGFAGSFHCVGMCGPIALTLPVRHLAGMKKMTGILLYNAGRASAYALGGLLFGWLGQRLYVGGLQQWLSIAMGTLLLLILLLKYAAGVHFNGPQLPGALTGRIRSSLGALLQSQRFSALYAIGFLNGLLPCGLVYLGIAGAVATGDALHGMLFMAAFGAGTLPAMTAVACFGQLLSLGIRNRLRRTVPVMIGIMGILLILRGMNLGIPYVSPVMHPQQEKVFEHCHKP
ncbi:sulfite exporter TauE/SafE family protein [Chitinophaga vietnamensis]|uniref:sulfite exporter TauE/SafE family protein n=1 Tax=Chitinophaga vietnamensis TaxID=2593957 RepID=UPI00137565C7|nr:sulfite exporter TauE/SafE family protein [Chitinophaga vietnamensis]